MPPIPLIFGPLSLTFLSSLFIPMSSSSQAPSSLKGKAKSKTSPSTPARSKRTLTLEEQISDVETKIARHQAIVASSQEEMAKLQERLALKKKLDEFMDVVTSDICLICKVDLSGCIGERDMGLVSYKCKCTKLRLVHLGCFLHDFKCSCGETATLAMKSSAGKDVSVDVSEVVDLGMESEDDFN